MQCFKYQVVWYFRLNESLLVSPRHHRPKLMLFGGQLVQEGRRAWVGAEWSYGEARHTRIHLWRTCIGSISIVLTENGYQLFGVSGLQGWTQSSSYSCDGLTRRLNKDVCVCSAMKLLATCITMPRTAPNKLFKVALSRVPSLLIQGRTRTFT